MDKNAGVIQAKQFLKKTAQAGTPEPGKAYTYNRRMDMTGRSWEGRRRDAFFGA
ncbi:MAG: hypothetical protein KH128_05230 [Firmicutes bacterium]|nr:hypothetical protein [Bacillota bacterium]